MTERRFRSLAAGIGLAIALLGTAACASESDGADPDDISTQTSFPTVEAREVPDPCAAITPDEVATLIGVDALETLADGGSSYRGCSYTDVSTDLVALTTTVYASNADFEDVWSSVAESIQSEVLDVEVAGAEGARLIIAEQEGSLAISGVASANGIVDQVNLLTPAPFDRNTQIAAATTILESLVAQSSS